MKTNRKKMLLSSIAMLLVALVALGSATYAWFTFNKTVNATNMKLTVAAQKGLVITGKNGASGAQNTTNWGPKYEFSSGAADDTFSPASLDVSNGIGSKTVFSTSFSSNADNFNGGKWLGSSGITATFDDVTTVAPITNTGDEGYNQDGYVAVYRVGVKSKDGTPMTNVKMSITPTISGSVLDYSRIAVQDVTNNTVKLYATAETGAKALTSKTDTTGTAQTFTGGITSATKISNIYTIASLDDTAHFFNIYVWFEGEDEDCTAAQASGDISLAVEFQA
jgi:hypothetical protein